ncbi:nucleoside-diphosphate-sugar epimerase [Cupriavidus gilardii J11]|uniref:Nucleoside-diphosphate-sugar epimerase n=1 Tax=Cupriavidus gilardii J11 TaxID=936133 RepID=A0A562BMW4_9BURK|nr:NAD-dependent epimerase/dehydratase family protein [Cupriavidus gilardii]TWG86421.1 nucleoside-diphosphate-sugar epimerase [Cupriavidus gilardii J11]
MTILVTGATGFIGRRVCQYLTERGVAVRAAVRSAGRELPAGVSAVTVGNIDGNTDWKQALQGVDVVIHLAGRAHVLRETETDALAAFRTVNRDGTLALFRAAQRAGVRRMVHVSSIGVYGPFTGPGEIFTAQSPGRPYNAYSQSKWEADVAMQEAAGDGPTEWVILRPPLVYGPGNEGNFLRLLKIVRQGWPLPLGSANAGRDMIYVDNLADALWTCATHPGAAGRVYVVRDGTPVGTAALIRALGAEMGRTPPLLPVPGALLVAAGRMLGRSDDITRLLAPLRIDDAAIRTELHWSPPVSMQQGIELTVKWFRGDAPEGY